MRLDLMINWGMKNIDLLHIFSRSCTYVLMFTLPSPTHVPKAKTLKSVKRKNLGDDYIEPYGSQLDSTQQNSESGQSPLIRTGLILTFHL